MKIVKSEYVGNENVFDLGINNKYHNFLLANGLVTSNCFNKAHSVSYSVLTYVSAYLKANYPEEFFAALMSTRSKTLQPKSWALKAHEYISEAKKFGVQIKAPDINRSSFDFTIDGDSIYFGFNAIRDVGKTAAKAIIIARSKSQFKDIWDFVNRINQQKLNTKALQALVKAGAFDNLGYKRSELIENTNEIYSYLKLQEEYQQRKIDIVERNQHNERVAPLIERRKFLKKEIKRINNKVDKGKASEDEHSLLTSYEEEYERDFVDLQIKRLPALKEKEMPERVELTRNEQVPINRQEVNEQAYYIGCFVGGHPMSFVTFEYTRIKDLQRKQKAIMAGVVISFKEIKTRAGKEMAFVEINDKTGSAEVVFFPSIWSKFKNYGIKEADIILVNGRVDSTDPEVKIIPNEIQIYREENEVDS